MLESNNFLILSEDQQEAVLERAAIMEFDGELTREDAERLALAAVTE